jgi:hypothetical protein
MGVVLDRSGQPDMAGNYKKALAVRKLLNVKDRHSNRHLYGRTTQLLAQIEKFGEEDCVQALSA